MEVKYNVISPKSTLPFSKRHISQGHVILGFSQARIFFLIVDVERASKKNQEILWKIKSTYSNQNSKRKNIPIITKNPLIYQGIFLYKTTIYFPEHTEEYLDTREVSFPYVAITCASHAVCLSSLPIAWIFAISLRDSVYFPMMKYVR